MQWLHPSCCAHRTVWWGGPLKQSTASCRYDSTSRPSLCACVHDCKPYNDWQRSEISNFRREWCCHRANEGNLIARSIYNCNVLVYLFARGCGQYSDIRPLLKIIAPRLTLTPGEYNGVNTDATYTCISKNIPRSGPVIPGPCPTPAKISSKSIRNVRVTVCTDRPKDRQAWKVKKI